MAVIRMPIEIIDVDTGDFECIQESASVFIENCDELPVVELKDGYAGMSDKIKALIYKQREDSIPVVGVDGVLDFSPSSPSSSSPPKLLEHISENNKKKIRKNATFRRFSLGHRHTVRNYS